MRLVYVEWVDSARGDAWTRVGEECDDSAHAVRSVGWLVRDTKEIILVAPHHAEESEEAAEQICGHMKIPKVAITKMLDLTIPKGAPNRTRGRRKAK